MKKNINDMAQINMRVLVAEVVMRSFALARAASRKGYRRVAPTLLGTVMLTTGCNGMPSEPLGVRDGRLAACPATPNCVSSDEAGTPNSVAPFRINTDSTTAWRALDEVVTQLPRTRIVTRTEDYMHVEFTSLVFRFVDDVEFQLRPAQNIIAVRSASRLGKSDLGVNARRVERIRALLLERGAADVAPSP